MLELVGAYAPFANGGYAVLPHVVERDHGRQRQGALCAQRSSSSAASSRRATSAMMNTMMQETLDHRHRAQGRIARLAGGRQDRHLAGFPRCLVHRLHRASRHRRLARQRRQLADQAGDRRRPCRSKSGAGSCGPRIRACRSRACRATSAAVSSPGCSMAASRPTPPARCTGRGQ